jgi:hypothetical protein
METRDRIDPVESIEISIVRLGAIGRSADAQQVEVNREISSFIPELEKFLENGQLKPMQYEVVGDVGMNEVLKGLDAFQNKKGSEKKIVVRLAEA